MERTFRKAADEAYPQKIFAHQLITIDDLEQFKKQLLEELLTALRKQTGAIPKKWLKSHEVRRLLKISPGTLQTLKSTGVIPYTKIGGVYFYDYDDIQKLLELGKMNAIQGPLHHQNFRVKQQKLSYELCRSEPNRFG